MNYLKILPDLIKSRDALKQSHEDVLKKQQDDLHELLRYAYKHSTFYHRKFKEAGINEDNIGSLPIEAFPTIDKEEIINNYEDVITDGHFTQKDLLVFDESGASGLFENKWHVVHSSGSTGEPRYFVYDEKAWHKLIISGTRSFFWNMSLKEILSLVSKKVRILYVAISGNHYGGASMVMEASKILKAEMLVLDVNEPLDNWEKEVSDFDPTIIIGYPSALSIMTEELKQANIRLKCLRVITCAESLSSSQRESLESYYGMPVVNFYAASESLTLGVETNSEEGMILLDDMNYVEIIDGAMYLTSLYNYGQPIIRYHISDSVEKMPSGLSRYGFSSCRIRHGRTDDIMWFFNDEGKKDFIHPTLLEDYCIKGLLGYQFLQLSTHSFCVNTEVSSTSDFEEIRKELKKQIATMLINHHMGSVKFDICHVDHIMPDAKTGKRRLCVALKETT